MFYLKKFLCFVVKLPEESQYVTHGVGSVLVETALFVDVELVLRLLETVVGGVSVARLSIYVNVGRRGQGRF